MSDLWVEASRDIEADNTAVVMIEAKMAAASIWPFLAASKTEREFEHRLALAEDRIDLAVPNPVVRDQVVAGFREDYQLYTTADSTWDAFDQDSKRRDKEQGAQLGESLWNGMVKGLGFEDTEHMRMHNQNNAAMDLRKMHPEGGSGKHAFDKDGDPYYKVTHPSGWHMRDYGGPQMHIGHEATGDDDHDLMDYGTGPEGSKRPEGLNESHLHQELNDWVGEQGATYAQHADPRIKQWQRQNRYQGSAQPLRIFHEASGQWITVEGAAAPTAANPLYPDPAPEAGPLTGDTGVYPAEVAGPDPHNPIQDMFPMQPSQWSENTVWVERPMSFAPYRQAAAYQNEGVQTGPGPNPDYFSGGGEGVAGNQQGGFPVDESLPEPNERVDFYGTVPPLQSGGTTGGDVPYSNGEVQKQARGIQDSPERQQVQKTNHGACFDCNRPVYRHGKQWKHLESNGQDDHHVRLHTSHPWVQQQMDRLRGGSRRQLTTVGFFDPADESVAQLRFVADVSSSDMGPSSGGGAEGGGGAGTPDPAPSMVSGGPGAQAMPPMTIPGPTSQSNPFSPGGGGGGQQQPPMPGAGGMMPMARFVPRVADVRARPTMDNPNGVADEYESNNWEKPLEMTPRQAPGDRGVNTPQRPRRPIDQVTSDGMGEPDEDDEEER